MIRRNLRGVLSSAIEQHPRSRLTNLVAVYLKALHLNIGCSAVCQAARSIEVLLRAASCKGSSEAFCSLLAASSFVVVSSIRGLHSGASSKPKKRVQRLKLSYV
jgi:hypothetical protein